MLLGSLSAGAEKFVWMSPWFSEHPTINVAGGQTHLRAWHTRSTWPPKHAYKTLLYEKQRATWLPQKSFCFQVEIGLVSKSLSETVFVRMCVIIWEELRGSCWEDICVRAWHLTLDLWMEFTHTLTHSSCWGEIIATVTLPLPLSLIDTDWLVLKLYFSYAKDNLRRKGQYTCRKMNGRSCNAQYGGLEIPSLSFRRTSHIFGYIYFRLSTRNGNICKFNQ